MEMGQELREEAFGEKRDDERPGGVAETASPGSRPCTLGDRGAITLLGDTGSVGDRGSQTRPIGFQKRTLSRAQFMGHFVPYLKSPLFMKVPAICLNFSLRQRWPSPERV